MACLQRLQCIPLRDKQKETMADKKGTGLLMVWVDVPAEQEHEFNHWYNEEHLAELLAVPGVLSAARYEAVRSGPKHLACYELESPAVMESPRAMMAEMCEGARRETLVGAGGAGKIPGQLNAGKPGAGHV